MIQNVIREEDGGGNDMTLVDCAALRSDSRDKFPATTRLKNAIDFEMNRP